MRWGDLFGRTLREVGTGGGPGAGLAQRAALARLAGEACNLLPLGQRAVDRMEASLRAALPPAAAVGLAPGASAEGWHSLVSSEIQSYRQLPASLSASRWARLDVDRPVGLARPRWTPSLQWLWAAGDPVLAGEGRDRWNLALEGWWQDAGLEIHRTEWGAHVGWAAWHAEGPQDYLTCPSCGYAAERVTARFDRGKPGDTALAPLEPVSTPGADTIRALADQLRVPARQTLKAVFLTTPEHELILVVLRGDLEVSPEKLDLVLGRAGLRPADEGQIHAAGAEPGFGSPVGLRTRSLLTEPGLWVVGDLSLPAGSNYVAGANRPDTHLIGVNYPRDFAVTTLADIAAAKAGDPCPECQLPLETRMGFWVARWETLPSFRYAGEAGKPREGAIGLGTVFLMPLLAALLAPHDAGHGLRWPAGTAPVDVYVVVLAAWGGLTDWVVDLEGRGLVVLVDDRAASAGVKFADADLIGARVRITVSARSLAAGGVEVARSGEAPHVVPVADVAGLF